MNLEQVVCVQCKKEKGRYEKFQIRKNPKPYKSGNILCHRLIKCQTCLGV
jgi:hypothetical protein